MMPRFLAHSSDFIRYTTAVESTRSTPSSYPQSSINHPPPTNLSPNRNKYDVVASSREMGDFCNFFVVGDFQQFFRVPPLASGYV